MTQHALHHYSVQCNFATFAVMSQPVDVLHVYATQLYLDTTNKARHNPIMAVCCPVNCAWQRV